MMAKMFYTLEEAQGVLGRNEEEIKQLSREGRLREFRDGQRMMFKADQVDALKAELGSGGGGGLERVDLGPSDSGMAIGLVDSRSGDSAASGVGLTLADTDENSRTGTGVGSGIGSGVGSGLGGSVGVGASGTGMSLKDDTALAADLGLSGSVGGIPSPSRSGSTGGSMSLSGTQAHSSGGTSAGTSAGTRSGVDIFQNDDVDRVDPAAQTAVGGGSENLSMESVGSGSGLLDLTRESDDTSLGAELLDEIAPGSSIAGPGGSIARRSPGESAAGGMGLVDSPPPSRSTTTNVVYEEPLDPMSSAFGLAALGATAVILVGAFALFSGLLNNMPPLMHQIASKGFPIVAGAGLAVGLIGFVIGLVLGKSAS